MKTQLVIVESPAKAKTIQSFLGSGYKVMSSYGHVRDLPRKDIAIDIDNDFSPHYITPDNQQEALNKLKQAVKNSEMVWLATDEDREGEAIAWHLIEALELDPDRTKRIAFHEITREAINQAMEQPRKVDQNLVDAQQARRVLDRLVGYKLSPVLWRKVRPGLSAGRVQSVAVRLIVEREREIDDFTPGSEYKITARFQTNHQEAFEAELDTRPGDGDTAHSILETSLNSRFKVSDVTQKPSQRNPGPPFTTSTLQQTASRKLGFSVRQTMTLAQRLYEAGHITYMRTDSVALADSAAKQAAEVVKNGYGDAYVQIHQYQNRADAQEAHEAIRPTDLSREQVTDDDNQRRLYELIRGRTLASQMAPATIEKTVATISATDLEHDFVARGEVVTFPGWTAAYQDSKIADVILPDLKHDEILQLDSAQAKQIYKRPPARYSEAALVRKLESMGIGRPSTYAPTITTVQDRGYVEKGDVRGTEQEVTIITADPSSKVVSAQETIQYGQDKNKLLPTQIAYLVNDFLTKNFPHIVDYDFTKEAEEEFDKIARGKEQWNRMIADFYAPFSEKLTAAESLSKEEASGARELGTEPESGKPIIARMGRYGPMLQLGHAEDGTKPKFAPIPKDRKIEQITYEEALELLKLPRVAGSDSDGNDIIANYGRYGPYVKSGTLYAPITDSGYTPMDIPEDAARQQLQTKREQNAKRYIADFGDIKVLDGRYGPYVTDGNKNARIPDDYTPTELDEATARQLLSQAKPRKKRGAKASKK